MSGSCCDKDCEDEHNELFICQMRFLRSLPKLHGQCCTDKCGCFSLKNSNK